MFKGLHYLCVSTLKQCHIRAAQVRMPYCGTHIESRQTQLVLKTIIESIVGMKMRIAHTIILIVEIDWMDGEL